MLTTEQSRLQRSRRRLVKAQTQALLRNEGCLAAQQQATRALGTLVSGQAVAAASASAASAKAAAAGVWQTVRERGPCPILYLGHGLVVEGLGARK